MLINSVDFRLQRKNDSRTLLGTCKFRQLTDQLVNEFVVLTMIRLFMTYLRSFLWHRCVYVESRISGKGYALMRGDLRMTRFLCRVMSFLESNGKFYAAIFATLHTTTFI